MGTRDLNQKLQDETLLVGRVLVDAKKHETDAGLSSSRLSCSAVRPGPSCSSKPPTHPIRTSIPLWLYKSYYSFSAEESCFESVTDCTHYGGGATGCTFRGTPCECVTDAGLLENLMDAIKPFHPINPGFLMVNLFFSGWA